MRIVLNGALGRMGKKVEAIVRQKPDIYTICAYCDVNSETPEVYKNIREISEKADVVIDFSNHSSVLSLLDYCVNRKLPVVIATTGHTDEEKAFIKKASESIAVFFSPNMSQGVAFLNIMAKKAAEFFVGADIEIVERHHNKKMDAPSGTALMLAGSIQSVTGGRIVTGRNGICPREQGDIGISSVRGGNVKGIHEINFYCNNETFTITHTAESRGMFAEGALAAAEYVCGKPNGMYNMDDLYGDI